MRVWSFQLLDYLCYKPIIESVLIIFHNNVTLSVQSCLNSWKCCKSMNICSNKPYIILIQCQQLSTYEFKPLKNCQQNAWTI